MRLYIYIYIYVIQLRPQFAYQKHVLYIIYQIIKLYPRRLFPSHAALFITPPWWKQVRSLTTNSGCHSMVPRFDEAQLMTSFPLSSVFPVAQGLSSASVCLVNNIAQYPKVLKHLFNFSYLFYQGLEPGIGWATPWLHSATVLLFALPFGLGALLSFALSLFLRMVGFAETLKGSPKTKSIPYLKGSLEYIVCQ